MKPTHYLTQSDHHVASVAQKIRHAAPGDRLTYDIETGADPSLLEHFDKPELLPYAGAYTTGISLALVPPLTGVRWDAYNVRCFYIPLGHERGNISQHGRGLLTEAFGCTQATHVGHNTPFDWAFLLNEGILLDVPVKAHDTQIKRWLQDENGTKKLKVLGEMWLGAGTADEQEALAEIMAAPYRLISDARAAVLEAYPELGYTKGKRGVKLWPGPEAEAMAKRLTTSRRWGQLTPEELYPYAAQDAYITAEVDRILDGQSPQATIDREMKVNAICIDMTRKGVSADVQRLNWASVTYAARALEVGAKLRDVHGLENPNSDDQVRALLYDRMDMPVMAYTEKGRPSVAKEALEQLVGDPTAADIMEYRKWDHARTAYAEPFARFLEHSTDGRVHGMYGTTRTKTGRLSANGPNVMTIPRPGSLPEIRAAFMLDPSRGTTRCGFDLKSAELWVTAHWTNDPVLTAILQEGRNMHSEMMVEVFGGEQDKERREYNIAKNVNYSMAYEAGLGPLKMYAAKGGYPPHQVEQIARRLLAGHKRMFKVQHQRSEWWAAKAQELGKLPLIPPGRFRHFKSPGKRIKFYTALNALVQGSIAEFMKDVMIEVYARGYGDLLILQVHDELVFDYPTELQLEQELLELLNKIAVDINPFKFVLQWDAKPWSMAA